MAQYCALFDANVLFSAELRRLILKLAPTELFRARWTHRINNEWSSSLPKRYSDITEEKCHELVKALNAVPDCLITDYEKLETSIELPDPHDRHVVAAAIKGRVDVIVTSNIKDFPEEIIAKYGIEVQTPDEFFANLLDLCPIELCPIFRELRLLKKLSFEEYNNYLKTKILLPKTARLLEKYKLEDKYFL